MSKRYDNIIQKVKEIDINLIHNWDSDDVLETKIIEKQKVYLWIRLYINDEQADVQPGDIIIMDYLPNGEKLETIFICYGKSDLGKDHQDEIINYNPEENRKILCIMVDQDVVNNSDEIPFIRTLFTQSIHYDYQLVRRSELTFTNKRTGEVLDYFDCDY